MKPNDVSGIVEMFYETHAVNKIERRAWQSCRKNVFTMEIAIYAKSFEKTLGKVDPIF